MVAQTLIEEVSSETAYQQLWRGGPVQGGGHLVPNEQGTKASKHLMATSILTLGVVLLMLYWLLISECQGKS